MKKNKTKDIKLQKMESSLKRIKSRVVGEENLLMNLKKVIKYQKRIWKLENAIANY